ncbi:hypothetical protein V8J82_06435 [Gymnodinialimonas sp. 2305UL16-5]
MVFYCCKVIAWFERVTKASQIAVPGGGPAMRGGFALILRERLVLPLGEISDVLP